MPYFEKGVQILNPDLVTFPVSCRTEEGIQFWVEWLKEQIGSKKNI
jgi:hydrogenase nickel incorporation protein HypB